MVLFVVTMVTTQRFTIQILDYFKTHLSFLLLGNCTKTRCCTSLRQSQ